MLMCFHSPTSVFQRLLTVEFFTFVKTQIGQHIGKHLTFRRCWFVACVDGSQRGLKGFKEVNMVKKWNQREGQDYNNIEKYCG